MDCKTVREQLSAFFDRELPQPLFDEVKAHLDACPECRAELASLEKTVQSVRSLEEVTPPSWLKQNVMEKVRAEARPRPGILSRLFSSFPAAIPLGAVATILVAAISLVLFRETAREPLKETVKDEFRQAPQIAPEQAPLPQVPKAAPAERPLRRDAGREAPRKEPPAESYAPAPPALPYEADRSRGASIGEQQDQRLAANQAASPSAPASAEKKSEAQSRPPAPAMLKSKDAGKEDSNLVSLLLKVNDPGASGQEVVRLLRELGASQLKEEKSGNTIIVSATLPGSRLRELAERLRKMGDLAEKAPDSIAEEARVRVTLSPSR